MNTKFVKSLDMKGAVLYNYGNRTELNRSQVDTLFRQLDAIRQELGIEDEQKKTKMDDWLEISQC